VALLVWLLLEAEPVVAACFDTGLPRGLVDAPFAVVAGRVDQSGRDPWGIPPALDEERPRIGVLDAELVDFVVEDQVVAERAGGELELVRDRVGVGTVGGEPVGAGNVFGCSVNFLDVGVGACGGGAGASKRMRWR
jgi:hypothetical protein